jgi:TfoX/Sxy family transcriptional regulator of competence genes
MAYDQDLAQRIRARLGSHPGLQEKKMFGGIAFLIQGNMACGVNGENLIVRVGPHRAEEALAQPNTRPFDPTGRPMSGWIIVTPAGVESENELQHWVGQGVEFAETLPPK